jgi:hypothetical protein
VKTKNILIRIEEARRTAIRQFAEKKRISISYLLDISVMKYMSENADSKDDVAIYKNLQREAELEQVRKQNTQERHDLFFVKNCLRVLYNLAQSFYVNSRGECVNMKVMRAVVNGMKHEFDKFPTKIKRMLRKDFEEIKQWAKPEYAIMRLEYIKRLHPEKKREFLEHKAQ